METHKTSSKEETQAVAKDVARLLCGGTLVCLWGDLGAGKTTFSQGVLAYFGAEEPYTSPTFVIMKEYTLPKEMNGIKRIYHVDAYRLEVDDIAKIGFEEWCSDPQGLVLLEWPERVGERLPEKRANIVFRQEDNGRGIEVSL